MNIAVLQPMSVPNPFASAHSCHQRDQPDSPTMAWPVPYTTGTSAGTGTSATASLTQSPLALYPRQSSAASIGLPSGNDWASQLSPHHHSILVHNGNAFLVQPIQLQTVAQSMTLTAPSVTSVSVQSLTPTQAQVQEYKASMSPIFVNASVDGGQSMQPVYAAIASSPTPAMAAAIPANTTITTTSGSTFYQPRPVAMSATTPAVFQPFSPSLAPSPPIGNSPTGPLTPTSAMRATMLGKRRRSVMSDMVTARVDDRRNSAISDMSYTPSITHDSNEGNDSDSSASTVSQDRIDGISSSRLLTHLSKNPSYLLKYTALKSQLPAHFQSASGGAEGDSDSVTVSLRILGGPSLDSLFFVAADLSQLIHSRKSNIAKAVSAFNDDERARAPVLCPRSNQTASTHILTVLTLSGVNRLLSSSRAMIAASLLNFIQSQLPSIQQTIRANLEQ